MDEEMTETEGEVFTVHEIDLDYEFDASKYFDFSREESFYEARQAELWLESAPSYPPSPFVAKLVLGENVVLENVNISPKGKEMETTNDSNNYHYGMSHCRFADVDMTTREGEEKCGGMSTSLKSANPINFQSQRVDPTSGFTFSDDMAKYIPKDKLKSTVKPSFPRKSTLMKPTASQLAKQNQLRKVDALRFHMPSFQNKEKSSNNSSGFETQAAKRQKLEGGHLRKVTEMLQQTTLVHKIPKKDGIFDGSFAHAKLKLTIPREPELETAHRAQRIRPKNGVEPEHMTSTAYRFRARPLNRKILEAPSFPLPQKSTPLLPDFQVFNLKTSERALQHTSAVSSSSLQSVDSQKALHKNNSCSITERGNKDFRRPISVDAQQQDGAETMHKFKARPLNKKILSSKGDIGVFRTIKKETTVPMEFNFQTEKRIQHNLSVDLFSKLSLESELRPNNGNQLKLPLPQPTCGIMKGSKENRLRLPQQEHEITHWAKERSRLHEQFSFGRDKHAAERCQQSGINRSLGIR